MVCGCDGLADVLAPFCFDQAIDRIVDVVVVGRHHLVVEVDRLLRVVSDVRDVADRVVGVAQILQPCLVRQPRGRRG